MNPEGFERALAELYPDVRYRRVEPVSGGKLALPENWQDERFDRVFCINTLEHVPREEREKLIAFIARMLKPGGRLITTLDYYFESSFSRQDWIDRGLVRSDRQEVFGGFNRIPPADLAEMCKRAGLSPLAPIPADPEEGDRSLYLQAAPLEHTTIGAVFSKGIAATPRPSRVLLAMLTWNTLAISRDSVGALVREARMLGRVGVEAGLCVVDNGSDDGTAQAIGELDAAIDVTHRFFLNPQNLGNSHARNQIIGYALSGGFDYVLFTDGDIEIVPFSTMAMLRYLECSPAEVGCIGAFSAGCSPRRTQSTPVLFSLSGFEIASSDVLAWTQYGMFRRSLFESGIRFDEDGPFGGPGHGFEDVDLVFQMRTRGFASHYFSGITYLHRHISSSVPNLRKGGLDPQKLYAERREHLLSKWKDVRSLDEPLRWVREVQSGYPASDRSGRASEWSAREELPIVRPDEHPQTCYDVVILPVFPFDFRYQRPQQIAARFAAAGHRVFWIDPSTSASLTGEPYVLRTIRENLWEVRLAAGRQDIYSGELTTPDLRQLRNCLGAFYRDCAIAESCVLIQLPFWRRLALAMRQEFGAKVVYDCMDEWAGFENIGPFNLAEEERLARECDFLAVSASRLSTRFEGAGLKPALIRNGCDFAFFQNAADEPLLPEIPRPVAGYFGAIAEWFDVELVYQVAKSRPHYSFVLAGQVHGVDVSKLQDLPNVFFPGQFPYQQMPALLREFDACMIPFCLNRLTQATDPVKLYEYLSLGKPVVATRMEELARCGDLIYTANHPEDFARLLDVALAEADAESAAPRMEFASHNDWDQRFAEFDQGIAQCFPAVSIVIVTYNSVEYIGACLRSIQRNTSYPNFEVVVADNCSFDGTAYVVEKFAAEDPRIRLMRLPSNVGFAAATNAAVRESMDRISRFSIRTPS